VPHICVVFADVGIARRVRRSFEGARLQPCRRIGFCIRHDFSRAAARIEKLGLLAPVGWLNKGRIGANEAGFPTRTTPGCHTEPLFCVRARLAFVSGHDFSRAKKTGAERLPCCRSPSLGSPSRLSARWGLRSRNAFRICNRDRTLCHEFFRSLTTGAKTRLRR
jgi:hypothetical protein